MPKTSDQAAVATLADALAAVRAAAEAKPDKGVIRRIGKALADHADAVEAARAAIDPVLLPTSTFDPADPKTIGRMVSLALIAQPLVPLSSITPAYGSGIYAIYYRGDHPFYLGISGSETPIYVGKADPADDEASTPREQGSKLTSRLLEHAGTIQTAALFAPNLGTGLYPLRLEDFSCRRLVCATNAQLAAERQLIRMFWPIWNQETKACWGMSKHGDSAGTRANKRSPWDVIHPGRPWALDARLKDSLAPDKIEERIQKTLARVPPRSDHAALLEEMLEGFRQNEVETGGLVQTPPVGEDLPGPSADEAGGDDN